MKENRKKFIASSEIFNGYQVLIDLNYTNSMKDIIDSFYTNLHTYLSIGNLEILLEHLKKANFHIHGYTYEDILLSSSNKAFYICDSCYNP